MLEGWTENGYSGGTCISLCPSTELNVARDKIAKGAGEVAKDRILELELLVEQAEDLTKAGWDAYHKLNRALTNTSNKTGE